MAFASLDDVAARMGRDALDGTDRAAATLLLELATGLIAEAVDKPDEWAVALAPVPTTLRVVCLEVAVRVLLNPDALSALSVQLGAHAETRSFRNPAAGVAGTGELALSAAETLRVRRAVFGRTTASSRTRSIVDDLYPCDEAEA